MKKILFSIIVVLILKSIAHSQVPIDIQVEIAEPYPTELEYYLQNAQNLFISVSNTSGIEQKIYYHVRLVGVNNSFDAQTNITYKPLEPVIVPTYGALFYSGQELERDFAFSYPEDVTLTSVSQEQLDFITFNRSLPEGTYQLCITARDFTTDIPLNFQCSDEFTISYGDIPYIYMPYNEEIVFANENNHITIGWEPPFTLAPPPGTFSYHLKMVDVTEDPFGDIELLMNNPGAYPTLDQADLMEPIYNYDFPPEIELIEGHQYALRVQAVDNTGTFPLSNNGYSEISTFWYGYNPNDGTGGDDSGTQPSDQSNDCYLNCYYEDNISENTATSLAGFPEIQVGNFIIKNIEFSSDNGSSASGTGTIELPFLNDFNVNVEFANLGINSQGRVYSGTVNAVVDRPYNPTQMTSTITEEMNNFIHNGRVISSMITGQGSMGLPLGMVQNIAGHNFMFGFTQMSFGPTQATCQVMQNLHIPQFGDEGWISMAMSDVCLIPGGFAGEYTLHPVNDYNIPYDGDLTFVISGSTSSSMEDIKDEATYFEVDCNGIKSFGLRGEVHFPKSTLVKENDDAEILTEKVKGTFATTFDRATAINENIYAQYGAEGLPEEAGLHFMVNVDIDQFQIKGLQGWGFEVGEAWVDVSDFENPPGIQWPSSYDDANISIAANGNATMQPTWTGIYIKEMELKTPPEFLGGNRREGVSVNNMIIDPLLTVTIAAEDLIGRGEGDVDGWSLSMDSLFITFVQNRLESGGFSGLLGMPITKENTYLRYTALIEDSNTENTSLDPPSYVFSIQPERDLEFPFLIAKATMSNNSYVLGKFTPNNERETYFEAFLEGGIGVSSELFTIEEGSNIPLTIPVVDFMFTYNSQDGFSNDHFGFCEDLAELRDEPISYEYDASFGNQFSNEGFGGFPINIEEAGLSSASANEFKFYIKPHVSIAGEEGGIAGSVGININSEYKTISGEKRLKLTGMDVSALDIYSEVYGLTMEGSIEFYNDLGSDNVGTKGARGDLQVMLPMGIGVALAAEFGTSVGNPNAAFGTAQNYNYWYLDGMAYFGSTGIPIAPAVGIYGIGGGVYVNMSRSNSDAMDQSEVNGMLDQVNDLKASSAGNNPVIGSGSLPHPSFGSYALKMATTLGTYPVATLLNMDVSIYGEFSKNAGLNVIEIGGDAFLMTPLSLRNKSYFWASTDVRWEKTNEGNSNFDGLIEVFVNVPPVLYGDPNNQNRMVKAAFHAETGGSQEWYFYAGTVEDRAQLNLKLPLLPRSTISAYLMAGHGLPTELPIPDRVAFLMDNASDGDGDNKLTDTKPVPARGIDRSEFDEILNQTGSGLAFGVEGTVSAGIDAWLLYATISATLGFDINITQREGGTCYIAGEGNISPGVNGWYALGQIYAALEGEMGIRFKFAGKEYDIELFYMAAAMMLSGGGPDPIWVEGRAGVTYRLLKGAVKGTAKFDVRFGDKCVPISDDPFGGLEIIYENSPVEGEKKVSVFVNPSVNFVLPMDEEFVLPVMNANGTTTDMTVILQVDKFYTKKVGGSTVPEKSQELDNSGQNIVIEFDEILSEKTDYEATVKVIGYERKSSGDVRLKDGDNNDWYEERKWTFKTGATPYPIPDEEIELTLPLRRQQYYMQDDNIFKVGLIRFTMDMKNEGSDGGYFPEDDDTYDYSYYVRWQDLEGGDAITQELNEVERTSEVDAVGFSVPELTNNTIYSCQLIRKTTRKTGFNNDFASSNSGIFKTLLYSKVDNKNDVFSSTEVIVDIPPLPGEYLESGEDLIYQFYFKTSKFGRMVDKLNTITLEPVLLNKSVLGDSYNNADINVYCDEDFDVFEIKGETTAGTYLNAPRLKIGSDEADGGDLSAMTSFFENAKDAFDDFDRDVDEIYEDSHSVTYSGTKSVTIGTSTDSYPWSMTLNHQPERKFVFENYNLSASNIYIPLNEKITGYRGKISDEQIANTWSETTSESNTGIYNLLTGYSGGLSEHTADIVDVQSSPKITITYDIHWTMDDEFDALAEWGDDIETKLTPVTYHVSGYTYTTTKNKWSDYLDDELPAFKEAVDDIKVERTGLSWYPGRYKVTFGINSGFELTHMGSQKVLKGVNLDW